MTFFLFIYSIYIEIQNSFEFKWRKLMTNRTFNQFCFANTFGIVHGKTDKTPKTDYERTLLPSERHTIKLIRDTWFKPHLHHHTVVVFSSCQNSDANSEAKSGRCFETAQLLFEGVDERKLYYIKSHYMYQLLLELEKAKHMYDELQNPPFREYLKYSHTQGEMVGYARNCWEEILEQMPSQDIFYSRFQGESGIRIPNLVIIGHSGSLPSLLYSVCGQQMIQPEILLASSLEKLEALQLSMQGQCLYHPRPE